MPRTSTGDKQSSFTECDPLTSLLSSTPPSNSNSVDSQWAFEPEKRHPVQSFLGGIDVSPERLNGLINRPRHRYTLNRLLLLSLPVVFAASKFILHFKGAPLTLNLLDLILVVLGTIFGVLALHESDPPAHLRWLLDTNWPSWRETMKAWVSIPHEGITQDLMTLWSCLVIVLFSSLLLTSIVINPPLEKLLLPSAEIAIMGLGMIFVCCDFARRRFVRFRALIITASILVQTVSFLFMALDWTPWRLFWRLWIAPAWFAILIIISSITITRDRLTAKFPRYSVAVLIALDCMTIMFISSFILIYKGSARWSLPLLLGIIATPSLTILRAACLLRKRASTFRRSLNS